MSLRNTRRVRAQAENCFHQSELTNDRASKLHWLTLAEAWLLLADTGARGRTTGNRISLAQRQDARHLPDGHELRKRTEKAAPAKGSERRKISPLTEHPD